MIYSPKMTTSFVCLFILIFSGQVSAESIPFRATVGLLMEKFNYYEKDNGKKIDTEQGGLPGFLLNISTKVDPLAINASFKFLQGDVDYNAYPSSSRKLVSRTTEKISEFQLTASFQSLQSSNMEIIYFTSLGLRLWDRDIHSLPDTPGLAETYTWPYVSIGVKPRYQLDTSNSISLALSLQAVFNATLDVSFKSSQFDSTRLDMKNGQGLKLALAWVHKAGRISFSISPYIDLWRFNRSDPFPLKKDGVVVGVLTEPTGLTQNAGMMFLIVTGW
jgi:hypothetical protein